MFCLKRVKTSLFLFLLLVCSAARADYYFESIDGCVVEIKDWGTMYTDLVNLKSIANFKYSKDEKKAHLIYFGMGKKFTIAKVDGKQAEQIKSAYLRCTNAI